MGRPAIRIRSSQASSATGGSHTAHHCKRHDARCRRARRSTRCSGGRGCWRRCRYGRRSRRGCRARTKPAPECRRRAASTATTAGGNAAATGCVRQGACGMPRGPGLFREMTRHFFTPLWSVLRCCLPAARRSVPILCSRRLRPSPIGRPRTARRCRQTPLSKSAGGSRSGRQTGLGRVPSFNGD